MDRREVVLRVSVHLVEPPLALIISVKFLRNFKKHGLHLDLHGFRFIMSAHFNTMTMNSLGNVAFDFFGCLHQIVQFGIFHDFQSVFYRTKLDEDLLTVFLQLGKFVLCKSYKVQKIS
jgi:hypothetical protein